ncbi:MAG TPA: hypothetical protein VMA73_31350 [Streptosporangiaceae bacterium]|nr:hypothetical protein [Streptosporangiaceae bacterium]
MTDQSPTLFMSEHLPFPNLCTVPLAQASPAATTCDVRAFAWLLAINTSRNIALASAACTKDSVTMLAMRATGTNDVNARALLCVIDGPRRSLAAVSGGRLHGGA